MLSAYPACFIKEDHGYSIIFPDLNNLATCGETLDEAFFMAADCLAGYLHWLQQDGDIIPTPSSIETINIVAISKELEVDVSNLFVHMVIVDVEEYAKIYFEESIRKTITIPTWLNISAIEHDIDFSQVLQDALKKKLHLD